MVNRMSKQMKDFKANLRRDLRDATLRPLKSVTDVVSNPLQSFLTDVISKPLQSVADVFSKPLPLFPTDVVSKPLQSVADVFDDPHKTLGKIIHPKGRIRRSQQSKQLQGQEVNEELQSPVRIVETNKEKLDSPIGDAVADEEQQSLSRDELRSLASNAEANKEPKIPIGNGVAIEEELQSHTNDVVSEGDRGSESSLKDTLAWLFVVINVILEIPSLVFDQLSSIKQPQYALIAMLITVLAMAICIVELIWERMPWFYCRLTRKPLGTLWQLTGVACAVPQCIIAAINYSFICQEHDGPIKISVWPLIFALGLFFSKLFQRKTNPKVNILTYMFDRAMRL